MVLSYVGELAVEAEVFGCALLGGGGDLFRPGYRCLRRRRSGPLRVSGRRRSGEGDSVDERELPRESLGERSIRWHELVGDSAPSIYRGRYRT